MSWTLGRRMLLQVNALRRFRIKARAIEGLLVQDGWKSRFFSNGTSKDLQGDGNPPLFSNWINTNMRQAEIMKEPYLSSFMQSSLLHGPDGISADDDGNCIFLSDSNHHRIIIFDGDGKILDCIGSSPGFEDGNFESAKMARPAASFFDSSENSLYFVDSENHAIRRADLGSRVLETLHPGNNNAMKNGGFWSRILSKLGFRSNSDSLLEVSDSLSLTFPWHLIKSVDGSFLVLNRSLATLWIIDLTTGEIKEVVEGLSKIMEICGQLILEKLSLLNNLPHSWIQQQTDASCMIEGLPHASLLSAFTTFQNDIVICDTVGQGVLRLNKESGYLSHFQLSNFGVLGLPYWLAVPLERVLTIANGLSEAGIDHLQSFSLLPGRVGVDISVELPVDSELVEPLQEGCIWCQARGTAMVVSEAEDTAASPEKTGVAQQWYDELDNLAYSTPEPEMNEEEAKITPEEIQDDKVRIHCDVSTSPGSSEVVIYAALYLKLRSKDLQGTKQEKLASRIADILYPKKSMKAERKSCIQSLKTKRDLKDFIFVRPIHIRIQFDCPNYPKDDNTKNVIITDSSVEVNVSLKFS